MTETYETVEILDSDDENDPVGKLTQNYPGPLKNWFYKLQKTPPENIWNPYAFLATLFPPTHLDNRLDGILKDSIDVKKGWGSPHSGYPHVENVSFRANANSDMGGNCYFGTISFHIYGSNKYWATVKAQHLAFVDSILRNKKHPRFELYTKINSVFTKAGNAAALNMWQRLNIAHEWQNSELMQVTADLYNLFLIQYEVPSREPDSATRSVEVTSVKIRGDYNSTHTFIGYVQDCHYQPLVPCFQRDSEVLFPQVTWENTQGKRGVNRPKWPGDQELKHPWRVLVGGTPVPEPLFPIKVIPVPTVQQLELVVGFRFF